MPFLAFPVELRQIVYTTNAIEIAQRPVPQGRPTPWALPHRAVGVEGALPRRHRTKRPNRANPTGQINGWKTILNTLTIHYGDRIEAAN